MKRLLVVTAAIAVLTAANLRAGEERKAEGGKAAAPGAKVNTYSGSTTVVGGTLAISPWGGGKSAAQWYIESIDKVVSLSDAQKKAITQTIEARDKFMQEFQAQNKEKLQAAGKAIGEAFQSKDKEKTAQAQKAYQDIYAPMHEAMKKSQQALDEILTPEQREKLQDNRMAALIKTLTDPVQLSQEQLGKVKAAYRAAAKKGEPEAMRALTEAVQNGLTPEQKTTIVKHRAMNYAKAAFGRAKLSDEQMKKAEAMIDELAKDPDPKMQWQVYSKVYEKLNALLTPEQKEAMKAPFTLSGLTKSGGGTVTLSNSSGNVTIVEGAKLEGGKAEIKSPDAGKPGEKPAKKQEPGATFKLNPVPGGGLQIIIGEGGKLEGGKAEPKLTVAQLRADQRKAGGGKEAAPGVIVNSGTVTTNVWGGKSAAQWYIESTEKTVPLTEEQKKAIAQAIEARDKAMQEFQAQNKEKIQAAATALGEAYKSKDKDKIAQAQKAYQELYAPMHEAMKKSQKALDDILTPQQREKIQENQMATWIKAMTDPVQLSPEQLDKAKAAYRELTKNAGHEARERSLPDAMQKILTPEQKTTIFKHRQMSYVKMAYSRAKLNDEQMKKIEAMVDELAKTADPSTTWQSYQKLAEKINALLTPEQKEAMKAPFTLSGSGGLIKSGSGTLTLGKVVTIVEGAKVEGGKAQPKSADACKPGEKPAKKQEPGEKKESGATLRLNAVPGGGLQIIIGEGGKVEIKSPDAGKLGENAAKKKEGGVSIQKLPGGGIQVIIRETGESREGERREALEALEKARRSLEEAAKAAKSRMFERVKRQHELAEQAWQLAQRLQSLGEDKKAEAYALRGKLEAVEGQLRGTFQAAPGTPAVQRREMTLQPGPGTRPAPGGWVQVQPGVATYSLEAQLVPAGPREALERRLKSLREAAEQLAKEGKTDQAKALQHEAQEVHNALEQLGRQSRLQPRPGQPLVYNLTPGQPLNMTPAPGQPPLVYGFAPGQPPNPMPGQPVTTFNPMPGQPPGVRPDPAIQELGRQVQELRRQVQELKAIVTKAADPGKK